MAKSSSPTRTNNKLDSDSNIPPSPYRVGNWTVTKLKEELKQRNLVSYGRKLDLIERLEESDRTPVVAASGRRASRAAESSEVDDDVVQKVLGKMSVAQLQEELMRRGLSPVGKKNELVARLAFDDVSSSAAVSSSSPRGRTRSPVRKSVSPSKAVSPSKGRSLSPVKTTSVAKRGGLKFWREPVETFTHLGAAFAEYVNGKFACLKEEPMALVSILALLVLLVLVDRLDGVHQKPWRLFVQVVTWLATWFLRGVLSSFSLGVSGNGFPMFLSPFLAQVTTTAFYCKSLDFPLFGDGAFKCGPLRVPAASLVGILIKVSWPLLAYGLGVVVGQIPLFLLATCTGNAIAKARKTPPLACKCLEATSFRSKYIMLLVSSMVSTIFLTSFLL